MLRCAALIILFQAIYLHFFIHLFAKEAAKKIRIHLNFFFISVPLQKRRCRRRRQKLRAKLSWVGLGLGLSLRVRDPALAGLSRQTELASDTCGQRRFSRARETAERKTEKATLENRRKAKKTKQQQQVTTKIATPKARVRNTIS